MFTQCFRMVIPAAIRQRLRKIVIHFKLLGHWSEIFS